MSRLGGAIDGVIGVDPHRDTLAAAGTDAVGGLLAQTSVSADATGSVACSTSSERRCPVGAVGRWRVPAATAPGWQPSYRRTGSGWSRWVGPSGRLGAPGPRATPWTPFGPHAKRWPKTTCWHPVAVATGRRCGAAGHPPQRLCRQGQRHQPAQGPHRGAPEEPRAELRGLATKRQITGCARLRARPARSLEHRMTVRALCSTAQRIQLLDAEAAGLRAELERLVAAIAPWLLELPGSGRSAPPRSW
jgi:transposase